MTANRDSSPPAKVRDDEEKPLILPSVPPPPPVRARSLPPPPPQRAASIKPPPAPPAPPARVAARRDPPAPPKRSVRPPAPSSIRPPAPSSVAARASASSLPPPLPSSEPARPRSVPPPLPTFVAEPVLAAPVEAPLAVVEPAALPQITAAEAAAPLPVHAEPAVAEPEAPTAPVRAEAAPIPAEPALAEAAPIPAEPALAEAAPIPAEPALAEAAPIAAAEPVAADAAETPPIVVAPAVSDEPAAPEAATTPLLADQPTEAPPANASEAAVTPECDGACARSYGRVPAVTEPPLDSSEAASGAESAIVAQPSVAEAEAAAEPAATPAEPTLAAAFAALPVEPPTFSSPSSEMPVVLSTPTPHVPERRSPELARLLRAGREWLPQAHDWSQKTLRAAPRALVLGAPIAALFGIWAIHGLVSHHRHAAANAELAAAATVQAAASQPGPAHLAPAVIAATATANPSAFLVSASAAASITAAPTAADPTELARALTHGLPALEALAEKFPADAQVAVALASQQAQAQRFEAAVATIDHLLSVAPSSAQNGKVMGILWRAAQSPASEQSFSSLRKLGGRGSDVAFDLATTSGVRDSVRERAKAELGHSLAFDASDDTRVATALLLAPDCETRKSLLERAEREGGKRTLAMLERVQRGAGCTSGSEGACNSCLMGSPVLAHALAQLGSGAKP